MPSLRTRVARAVFLTALISLACPLHAASADATDVAASEAPVATSGAPASRGTELAIVSPADGLILAAQGPGVDVPWILSPLVRGTSGAQALWTARDESGLLLRLGGGWADVQSTGDAPPFQRPPSQRWNLDGTELVWRHDGGEFYASMQRRNWGPGWTGSLILDGAAQPLAAVGWRRPQPLQSSSPWLKWMGPWSADVFFGRLSGHEQPQRPALIGMRLQVQPFEPLQFGLSRALQWGGHGRDESAESLVRAVFGADNVGSYGVTRDNEPGNQLGGFDFRLQLGDDAGNALYGQAIGEDKAGGLPSGYIVQAGLQGHALALGADWLGFLEWNDTIVGDAYKSSGSPGVAYRHSIYQQGYTNDHMPLGYPAGGDVTLTSVGLLARMAAVQMKAVASRGNALPTAQRFAPGPISGLNGSLQVDIEPHHQVGAALWWWRDSAEQQSAVQLWFSLRL